MYTQQVIDLGTKNLNEIKTVKELKNAKLNQRYYSFNYTLFYRMKGNRGGKESSKRIEKLIRDGKFNYELTNVLVGTDRKIVEGHCSIMALKKYGMPIVFTLITPKTLEDVADFNSGIRKAWTPDEHFLAAVEAGKKLALLLYEIGDELNTKYRFKKSLRLRPAQLMACMTENPRFFSGGKNSARIQDFDILDDDVEKIDDAARFRIEQLARMKFIMSFCGYESQHHIIKYIMPLHFDKNIDFDIEVFVDAIEKERFTFAEANKKCIQGEALKLYKREMKLRENKNVPQQKNPVQIFERTVSV